MLEWRLRLADGCPLASAYLTAYLLHVFKTGSDLKCAVDASMRERALQYLERELSHPPPTNEGWWPSYTAWQAFAVKVLVESGRRNQDSNLNRLYGYRDRMPVFGLAYLHDALTAVRGSSPTPTSNSAAQIADLRRRMLNAILPEAGGSHVEELSDPYLLWFWNSNVRTTAIVLNALVRGDVPDAPIRQIVRWMMAVREDGRWGNTQENALAMEALVTYYRKHESVVPDFSAVVKLGTEDMAREQFKGRSTKAIAKDLPMTKVLGLGATGSSRELTFTREGAGTLFYTARLRYASNELFQDGLDSGFNIVRTCEPYVETGAAPIHELQSWGSRARHADVPTHQAPLRRRHGSLPAGFEPVESWFARRRAALSAARISRETRARLALVVEKRRFQSSSATTIASSSLQLG
jgi:hypothetical protein